MPAPWYRPLYKLATEAFNEHPSPYGVEAVLFYLARRCQKKAQRTGLAGDAKAPDLGSFDKKKLAEVADAIAANLAADGKWVEVLHAPNQAQIEQLREELWVAAGRYRGGNADDLVDEALQKVVTTIVTGTNPLCSRCMIAAGHLARPGRPECRGCRRKLEVDGPANEYVFQAPFQAWARTIVRHLILDEIRRGKLRRQGWRWRLFLIDEALDARSLYADPRLDRVLDRVLMRLLEAIEQLPPRQRAVMIKSLCRADVDDLIHRRLHRLRPDLFGGGDDHRRFESDGEIGTDLETTASNVASNRSAARKKLVERNNSWREILNVLLPQASPL
jgi:DNA-directed RNA polymerase specialized sigma24 family protein